MKKSFFQLFLAITTVFITNSQPINAQPPQKISYQAVIRNASDNLIVNSTVSVRISILQGSSTGPAIYVERHTPSTNANGLISIEIGGGTIISGGLYFYNGPYFIRTEVDPLGGTSYSIVGTQQILSVPFALQAASIVQVDGTEFEGTVLTSSGDGIARWKFPLPSGFGYTGNFLQYDGFRWQPSDAIYATPGDGGNIGLGTKTPGAKLHVVGSVKFADGTQSNGKVLTSDSSGLASWQSLPATPTGTNGQTLRHNGTDWVGNSLLYNNGTNIGIGTTNPSSKLHIVPGKIALDGSTNPSVALNNGTYQAYLEITNNVFALNYNNAVRLGISNNGNVGIGTGTSAPGAKLHVSGSVKIADGTQGNRKVLTSDSTGLATWANGYTHYIGESYGGGIVFYVSDNGQHGLIAAGSDLGVLGIMWENGTVGSTGASGDGLFAGEMNTMLIVAKLINGTQNSGFAAKSCADYSVTVNGVTYGDWYLPSKYELNLLYFQRNVVGGFSPVDYWSSSEDNTSSFFAWEQNFNSGIQLSELTYYTNRIRPIRAF